MLNCSSRNTKEMENYGVFFFEHQTFIHRHNIVRGVHKGQKETQMENYG
jgi:hypothetical protein